MKQLFPDLWQTRPEHPFQGVTSHAYLLTRPNGNILFYGTGVQEDLQPIRDLGGVVRQYLSHRDEAGPALATIKQTFGSALCCHASEVKAIDSYCQVDVTFDTHETHLGNIEVVPTPGHTSGSTCFVYRSPYGKTYLFTGDSIYPDGESWGTRVQFFAGGRKSDLKSSLRLLLDLEPDVVISSASVGRSPVQPVTASEWRAIVDKAILGL
ncbi:Hydroxyacylglutathione hydrolase [Burkholderia lata]|uniref:MBL fold metallo-hydrolase n=1 Tax=Burkholderia lata (strain ATCC 17760 / DSM 23089 / LMG 22485 / NCIMB 9086 / R18194 / 383) TaxID=482957 RepID=UPI001453071A|nr:MBL fold metallo-hydrolase [Burkholderia lata]VWC60973.1 Hydroxyacylglutathione hydrolase [Burkholderia lata]